MPHYYSTFWLAIGNGEKFGSIWRWRDAAARLPSWAPVFLAELESSGQLDTAILAAGRSVRIVYATLAMLPALRCAARAALVRHRAAELLPCGQLADPPVHEIRTSADAEPAEVDDLPMQAWLRLTEIERGDVVEQYASRRPRQVAIATDRRR